MSGFRKDFADVEAAVRGTLADAARAGALSAADFLKLASLSAGYRIVGEQSSALIDFTAAPADYTVIPAAPGLYFMPVAVRILVSARGATVGPTASIGNNGTFDNYCASTALSGTAISGQSGAVPYWTSGFALRAAGDLIDLATPIKVHVTGSATGGAFSGQVALAGWLTA